MHCKKQASLKTLCIWYQRQDLYNFITESRTEKHDFYFYHD